MPIQTLSDRITDVLQRNHELIQELKELSREFDDDVERLRSMIERMQARFEYAASTATVISMPQAEEIDFQIPQALKNGPLRRGE